MPRGVEFRRAAGSPPNWIARGRTSYARRTASASDRGEPSRGQPPGGFVLDKYTVG